MRSRTIACLLLLKVAHAGSLSYSRLVSYWSDALDCRAKSLGWQTSGEGFMSRIALVYRTIAGADPDLRVLGVYIFGNTAGLPQSCVYREFISPSGV